jgi:hypothetical protein
MFARAPRSLYHIRRVFGAGYELDVDGVARLSGPGSA